MFVQGAGCSLLVSLNGLDDRSGAGTSPDGAAVAASGDASTTPMDSTGASSPTEAGAVGAAESSIDAADSSTDTKDAAMGAEAGGDPDSGTAPPVYLGCFQDSTTRDLSFQAYDNQMHTTAACVGACIAQGYQFAATQSGSQCFCGNAYGGQGPAGACASPCAGDATEVCGGNWQNSVYVALGPLPRLTYLGCYADSMTRELPDQVFGGQYTTVESCAADCAYHGYFYAGPENGDQCFCGDTYGTQGPGTGCTDPCTGNGSEVCGGSYQNSVYATSIPQDGGGD